MPQTNQNKLGVWTANTNGDKWTSLYPAGNRPNTQTAPTHAYYFNAGDTMAMNKNGMTWTATTTIETPAGETEAGARFEWPASADPRGQNSFERHFDFPQKSEFWLRTRFYIPPNYFHRFVLSLIITGDISTWQVGDVILSGDAPHRGTINFIDGQEIFILFAGHWQYGSGTWTANITNLTRNEVRASTRNGAWDAGRKFMALYCDGYSGLGQSPTIVLGLLPDEFGNSVIDFSYSGDGSGTGQLPNSRSETRMFITLQDRDSWFEFCIHVKQATAEAALDGQIELFYKKDGWTSWRTLLTQYDAQIGPRAASAGDDRFRQGYLFGYWNSVEAVNTLIHVSEVEVFSTKPNYLP